jgi:hypothetical protein
VEAFGNCYTPKLKFKEEAVDSLRAGMRSGRERLESFYKKRIGCDHWPARVEVPLPGVWLVAPPNPETGEEIGHA